MKRLSLLNLVFALLFAVFLLLLVYFRVQFPLYPLMSYQDVLDLLTPLILIPIYWLIFKYGSKEKTNLAQEIIFIVLAGLWILGHGMHLSANSINNLSENLEKQNLFDVTGTSIYSLTYFYDEYLSHYLWHTGILGLIVLICYREWVSPAENPTGWWATIVGGFIYGFSSFCIFLEGNTVWIGLPFILIFTLIVAFRGLKKLSQQPILAFFFISNLVALFLFLGWGLYYGGFPPPSAVGLI